MREIKPQNNLWLPIPMYPVTKSPHLPAPLDTIIIWHQQVLQLIPHGTLFQPQQLKSMTHGWWSSWSSSSSKKLLIQEVIIAAKPEVGRNHQHLLLDLLLGLQVLQDTHQLVEIGKIRSRWKLMHSRSSILKPRRAWVVTWKSVFHSWKLRTRKQNHFWHPIPMVDPETLWLIQTPILTKNPRHLNQAALDTNILLYQLL